MRERWSADVDLNQTAATGSRASAARFEDIRPQEVHTEFFEAVTGASISKYDEHATTTAVGLVVRVRPAVSLYGSQIEGLTAGPVASTGTDNAGEVFPHDRARIRHSRVFVFTPIALSHSSGVICFTV
jgi:hypothetical protein